MELNDACDHSDQQAVRTDREALKYSTFVIPATAGIQEN